MQLLEVLRYPLNGSISLSGLVRMTGIVGLGGSAALIRHWRLGSVVLPPGWVRHAGRHSPELWESSYLNFASIANLSRPDMLQERVWSVPVGLGWGWGRGALD